MLGGGTFDNGDNREDGGDGAKRETGGEGGLDPSGEKGPFIA